MVSGVVASRDKNMGVFVIEFETSGFASSPADRRGGVLRTANANEAGV